MQAAAVIGAALIGVIAVFQIALALGMPARKVAWGGAYAGALPVGLRIASGITGFVVYPAMALAVLEAGGLVDIGWVPDLGAAGMWVLTGFFTLGAIANIISRSRTERWWAPVSLAIAICCGVLAAGL